jgi:hypothetical protein
MPLHRTTLEAYPEDCHKDSKKVFAFIVKNIACRASTLNDSYKAQIGIKLIRLPNLMQTKNFSLIIVVLNEMLII